MTLKTKKVVTILIMITLMTTSIAILNPVTEASATKVRACTTNQAPKGVDSITTAEVWVANDGGTLQKFTNLSTDCTNTSYTVGGDPHFIDRTTTTQVEFTNHVNNKITYFDPTTSSKIDCTNTNINSPDDIDSDTASAQYSTSYNNGKVIKTVKGIGTCTVTAFSLPLAGANPEGIDKSTDVGGFLVVDQANNKLYKFSTSTNSFTLCTSFSAKPFFVADDSSQDLSWVTFGSAKVIKAVGTLSCLVVKTSALTGITPDHWPYDVAVKSGVTKVVVSYSDLAGVGIYDIGTDSWTNESWNTECSGCAGFGIDVIYSTGDYYAAMRGGTTSKIVKGTA